MTKNQAENEREESQELEVAKPENEPWAFKWQEVGKVLKTELDSGLDSSEAKRRLRQYGKNRLREAKRKSILLILAEQFKSLMVLLLGTAACLSFIFGDWVEGISILAVILINAGIGFFMEIKAVRSMEALQQLSRVSSRILRDGEIQEISAESIPVSKDIEPLETQVTLAERSNMLFKGTAVTRGSGKGVVIATNTELGKISSLVAEAEEERTPLEKRLDKLGRRLIWVTIAITVVIAISGILAGKEMFLMIETAIALAVAAIPEGLPIVATIALAQGMWRMSRRNALVRHLSAMETLGSTNVICTDKTGTLTENRLTVTRIAVESGNIDVSGEGLETTGIFTIDGQSVSPSNSRLLKAALEIGVLCNNASLQNKDNQAVGEPLEVALLVAGAKAGAHRDDLLEKLPEKREVAFDPDVKMMATFHKDGDEFRVAVKGAPESILGACSSILTEDGESEFQDQKREQWMAQNEEMAEEGFRIIALATKKVDSADTEPYENLTFLGLVGMLDPPREDVREAIERCHKAGIRTIMVTGDQPVTARNVAIAVSLVDEGKDDVIHSRDLKSQEESSEEDKSDVLETSIFARVSPRQKLDLIAIHQKNGSVVAMTGDGVNDAPALKKADIGVAMGQRGTQVARESADMVLKDDAFSTIVAAIEQGRIIFNNICSFVIYLLSCNVSEVMAVSLASLVNAPLPILPLQILFLNLVTDVFPALALGVGRGDTNIMKHRPRDSDEAILTRRHWLIIGGYGFVITISVLASLFLSLNWLGMEKVKAITISFLTLAFAQLWHVLNMRDANSGFIHNDITQNPFVWGALALCCALLFAAVYIPGLAEILEVVHPGNDGWLLVLIMSLLPWGIGQITKMVRHHIGF